MVLNDENKRTARRNAEEKASIIIGGILNEIDPAEKIINSDIIVDALTIILLQFVSAEIEDPDEAQQGAVDIAVDMVDERLEEVFNDNGK